MVAAARDGPLHGQRQSFGAEEQEAQDCDWLVNSWKPAETAARRRGNLGSTGRMARTPGRESQVVLDNEEVL